MSIILTLFMRYQLIDVRQNLKMFYSYLIYIDRSLSISSGDFMAFRGGILFPFASLRPLT